MPYEIIARVNTKEVRGTRLVPVREFQVISLPSETYFEFRRDSSQPGFTSPGPAAQQLSDRIEAVLALPNVTDVVWSQNTTPAGQLLDWMTTYYATANGSISGSVESSLAQFGPNFTKAQIDYEISNGGDNPPQQVSYTGGGSGYAPTYTGAYNSPDNPQAPTVPAGQTLDAYNTPGAPGPGV